MKSRERVQSLLCDWMKIRIPYVRLGAVDSLDLLLNYNELVIFDLYRSKNYKRVVDVGANIGIHSALMSRQGWYVDSYEPDPFHFAMLSELPGIHPIQKAVSNRNGIAQFVRVLGNTTASHIRGSKSPYGDVETFSVDCVDVRSFDYDFMKLDVEGHEAEILLRLSEEQLSKMEIVAEVGSAKNAAIIFDHFQKIGFPIRSQMIDWDIVNRLEDMPSSHRDGSIFIGEL